MNNNKGMTTIEACVIIPISITIIMMLIWMGIYLYDRNVMDQAAARAAIVGSQNSELENEEIVEIAMRKAAELMCEKLVLVSNPIVEVTVGYNEIEVNVSGYLMLPDSFFYGQIYNKRAWSIDITEKSERLKSSMFVRTVNRLSKGLVSMTH